MSARPGCQTPFLITFGTVCCKLSYSFYQKKKKSFSLCIRRPIGKMSVPRGKCGRLEDCTSGLLAALDGALQYLAFFLIYRFNFSLLSHKLHVKCNKWKELGKYVEHDDEFTHLFHNLPQPVILVLKFWSLVPRAVQAVSVDEYRKRTNATERGRPPVALSFSNLLFSIFRHVMCRHGSFPRGRYFGRLKRLINVSIPATRPSYRPCGPGQPAVVNRNE